MIIRQQIYVAASDNLAEAFASIRTPADYTLSPGTTFTVDPCWFTADYRAVVPPNTTIKMNGSRIRLRSDAAGMVSRPDARDLWALTCGPNVRISGGVIDANEQAFRNSDPRKQWHALGIWSPVGPLFTEDVWVENVRGMYSTPKDVSGLTVDSVEAFAFLLNGSAGGHLIVGGGVRGGAENAYLSGINVGVVGDNPARSIVANFTVDIAPRNWMAVGLNQNVEIRGLNVVGGVQRGIHNDSDVTDGILVKSSHFKGINYLLSLVSPSGVHRKTNVRFETCTAAFADGTAWLAELWDKSVAPTQPAPTGSVLFQELAVTPRDFETWISMAGRSLLPVTFVDCALPNRIKSTAGNMLSRFNSPTEVQR